MYREANGEAAAYCETEGVKTYRVDGQQHGGRDIPRFR